MREWTERHIVELIKSRDKDGGGVTPGPDPSNPYNPIIYEQFDHDEIGSTNPLLGAMRNRKVYVNIYEESETKTYPIVKSDKYLTFRIGDMGFVGNDLKFSYSVVPSPQLRHQILSGKTNFYVLLPPSNEGAVEPRYSVYGFKKTLDVYEKVSDNTSKVLRNYKPTGTKKEYDGILSFNTAFDWISLNYSSFGVNGCYDLMNQIPQFLFDPLPGLMDSFVLISFNEDYVKGLKADNALEIRYMP